MKYTIDMFAMPTDHAWSMLKDIWHGEGAYEAEDNLTWMLSCCIKQGQLGSVKTKNEYPEFVKFGLVNKIADHEYVLTNHALNLLYEHYGKNKQGE